ncbi:hypothetical protein AAC387_Pa03g3418 [Persea americana]
MSALLSRVSSTARSSSILSRFQKKTLIPDISPPNSLSRSRISDSTRRIARISRVPLDSICLGSMIPLHNAIASARLNSLLSAESWSWGLTPQGDSMPL